METKQQRLDWLEKELTKAYQRARLGKTKKPQVTTAVVGARVHSMSGQCGGWIGNSQNLVLPTKSVNAYGK